MAYLHDPSLRSIQAKSRGRSVLAAMVSERGSDVGAAWRGSRRASPRRYEKGGAGPPPPPSSSSGGPRVSADEPTVMSGQDDALDEGARLTSVSTHVEPDRPMDLP